MKSLVRNLWVWTIVLCIAPMVALAQGGNCPDIVQTALDAADKACAATGRNQACYGNVDLTAQPQASVADFTFNKVGDVVDVASIQKLVLSPMNESADKWGVALLRLQADLPDTLPGQNVTFLLFGDVEIDNAVAPDDTTQHPMQAFYLRTGSNDSPCDQAPESGMLVQTPEGAEQVSFNVNGVDVQMGSTVLFQADADNGMSVSTLEGAAFVAADDGVQLIPPGARSRIRLARNLIANGSPETPTSYDDKARFFRALPLRLLQRRIQVAAPLTKEQIDLIRTKIQSGELPCGEDPLPRCAHLQTFLQRSIDHCATIPVGRRPAFCARLRNLLLRVQRNLAQQTPDVPVTPGASIECDLLGTLTPGHEGKFCPTPTPSPTPTASS